MSNKLKILTLFLVAISFSALSEQARMCMESICIGDDVDQLNVEWVDVDIDYKVDRAMRNQLANMTVDELYYDYNEKLITDKQNLIDLAPHIIQLQKFDGKVLEKLAKVKAICTPMSLTGQIKTESETKLFVTFKVVSDSGGRGRLRIVQLEKEFNIFPPYIRPNDKERYTSLVSVLKADYPDLVEVRDIDARASSNKIAFANAVIGFRFFSDVNNPLIFRLRDTTDLPSIAFDKNRSSLCPELE